MNIKDFKPGQEVYVVEGNERRGYRTYERIVQSVGRKYVKVSPKGSTCTEEFAQSNHDDNFLERRYFSDNPAMLFATEEDITDYFEKIIHRAWVRENMSGYKLNRYSLEQLREIRRILS